jgi:Zn-dependent protease with chaperone function
MGLAGVLLALGLGFPTAAILISVGLLVAGLSIRIRGARLLRNEDAEPLDPVRDPRLANLVEGLVARLGVSAPAVWVSPGEVPNAAAVWRGGPQLLLRRGLLGAFSRTELEAVVAFLLVVHATGEARRAAWRFGEAGPGSSVVGALDVAAVADL